jgi:hypothetical protein
LVKIQATLCFSARYSSTTLPAKSYHSSSFSLSPLKVEELDAICKDKEEKEDKAEMGGSHRSEEVIVKPQVLLKVILNCNEIFSWYLHWRSIVAHLGGNKAIKCPCHWRSPVIPPPPYWNLLQMSSVRF